VDGSTGPSRLTSRRGAPRSIASSVIAFLLATASAVAAQGTVAPAPPGAQGDFAGLVDIGGRRLYLECQGTGSPTVVLEAGAFARGDYWTRDLHEPAGRRQMVLPAVAGITRVCTYDRPGTYSDPDPDTDPSGPESSSTPRLKMSGCGSRRR
jgi:hypothetical protein